MDNLIIHSIKYLNDLHEQAVATITYPPVNGNEQFSYYISLNENDEAPIYQYIRNKIDSGEIEIQPCDTIPPEVKVNEIREERNGLLAETDKYMTLDYPISDEDRSKIRLYRQALRDITKQEEFPTNVVWPEKPAILQS